MLEPWYFRTAKVRKGGAGWGGLVGEERVDRKVGVVEVGWGVQDITVWQYKQNRVGQKIKSAMFSNWKEIFKIYCWKG